MNAIKISAFDIFKIGPGPSSSHTIGPMKAANDFLGRARELPAATLVAAAAVNVSLWGSLSLTGKGHGTDRAVLAGLRGFLPETIDDEAFAEIRADADHRYPLPLGDTPLTIGGPDIVFEATPRPGAAYSNTLTFRLLAADGAVLLEKDYYSIGGGFIKVQGENEPPRPEPPFRYTRFDDIKTLIETNEARDFWELVLENEKALSGLSEKAVMKKLKAVADAMTDAVDRGLRAEGVLPGPIGLARKAPILGRRARSRHSGLDKIILALNAYAMAAAEENAAGHIVVTAPTSGSSGVLPGVIYALREDFAAPERKIQEGLLIAAAIGGIIKQNASIAGAEVGCQGEIGSASAMAAALLAHVYDYPVAVIENAAEIALEHHLGMTCDPVGGYVQIPCVERNAMGAVKAYNAYLLASAGNPKTQKVTIDEVIQAMWETGKHMSSRYKETAQGGLALCLPKC